MVSQIDATKPSAPIAYTADMRANFATAKAEIGALQTKTTGGPWLSIQGGTLQGPLVLFNDGAQQAEAVTLRQLNAAIAAGVDAAPYLSLAHGGTVSGNVFIDALLAVTRGPLFVTAPHADSSPSIQITNDGSANTSWPTITLSKKFASMSTLIAAQTNGVGRFDIFLTDPFGADNFSIRAWDDTGTIAKYPLTITRATGLITVAGDPTDPLGVATMQYVNGQMAARVFLQFDPPAPVPTTSSAPIMMGLAAVITPKVSGRLSVAVTGNVQAAPAGTGCYIFLQYGTGTPPAHGAAQAGTNCGVAQFTSPADGAIISFTKQAALNLTVGTAYWIDLAVQCYFGATANLATLTITAMEH